MLNVQQYLRLGHSLESLKEKYGIVINEYDDIAVLNYNQIESPRFHPICDECRALILEKNSWNVVARSFNRFYNLGEGHDKGFGHIRLPSVTEEHRIVPFDLSRSFAMTKLDGSLVTAWNYKGQWNFSTRKMAFAEGQTTFGMTFAELIKSADNFSGVEKLLHGLEQSEQYSFVFELTSPANRIVTPYDRTTMNLLTIVHNETGIETVDAYGAIEMARIFQIGSPYAVELGSWQDLVDKVNDMPSMEEGVVLVLKSDYSTTPLRIKIKNPKYVAIAHMRENGVLSPKNVLKLVMANETSEYLKYFPEDQKYIDLVQSEYDKLLANVVKIYDQFKDLEVQKDFALAIQAATKYSIENGMLFKMRKGEKLTEIVENIEPKKLSEVLGLKKKFELELGVKIESE